MKNSTMIIAGAGLLVIGVAIAFSGEKDDKKTDTNNTKDPTVNFNEKKLLKIGDKIAVAKDGTQLRAVLRDSEGKWFMNAAAGVVKVAPADYDLQTIKAILKDSNDNYYYVVTYRKVFTYDSAAVNAADVKLK